MIPFLLGLLYGAGGGWCYGWSVARNGRRFPYLWQDPAERRLIRRVQAAFCLVWPIIVVAELMLGDPK